MALGSIIDGDALLQVIWVSFLAGIGVTALFAIVIYGGSRASEARRTGSGTATGFGALAVAAALGFVGAVVFGLLVILDKG